MRLLGADESQTRQAFTLLWVGALALGSSACGGGQLGSRFPPPVRGVDAHAYGGADAVWLSRRGEIAFADASNPSAGYSMTVHARLQILTPGGAAYGRVCVPLDSWSKLESLHARSYAANPADEAWDVAEVASTRVIAVPWSRPSILYSDTWLHCVDVPASAGSVVEYRWQTSSSFVWTLPDWTFDDWLPVLNSELSVTVPPGWQLKSAYRALGELRAFPGERQQTGEGAAVRHTWKARDLPPLRLEPAGPDSAHVLARLHLTLASAPQHAAATWDDIASFYRQLTRSNAALSREEVPFELRAADLANPVDAAYTWVRDRIRYVAVLEGIGAFKPHRAAEVVAAGSGDCKDMANLLVELLRLLGRKAYPVLVGTSAQPWADPELPTLGAFDHAIVAIEEAPGKYVFADPTAKHHPLGVLPEELQGRRALVVRDDRGELLTLALGDPSLHRLETRWRLSRSGVSVEVRSRGQLSVYWREVLRRTDPEAARTALRAWAEDVDKGPLLAASVRADGEWLVATASFAPPAAFSTGAPSAAASTPGRSAPSLVFLPLGPFFGTPSEMVPDDERAMWIELGPPATFVTEVTVDGIGTSAVALAPKAVEVVGPIADYSLRVAQASSSVGVTRTFVRKVATVEAREQALWHGLIERFKQDSRAAIAWRGAALGADR